MGWNSIANVVAGTVISTVDFGLKVISNLNYLFAERPAQQVTSVGAADITISSTSWALVSASFTLTMTILSGKVEVEAAFLVTPNASNPCAFTIMMDGNVNLGDATYGLMKLAAAGAGKTCVLKGQKTSGISAGSHTFAIYAKQFTAGSHIVLHDAYPVVIRGKEIG